MTFAATGLRRSISVCFALGLAGACGSGSSPDPGVDAATVGSFDDELPPFITAVCATASQCSGRNQAQCEADVTTDMATAKTQLDPAGQARCARCMHVKTTEISKVAAASCDLQAADFAAILDACDLDPSTDFDGDHNPANDDDEACAGKP